jgi:hypothetical protein
MKIPFVGESYRAVSRNIDVSRTVNFYVEISKKTSKSPEALVGTEGSTYFTSLGETPARGAHTFNNLMYWVVYNQLYSIDGAGNITQITTSTNCLQTTQGRVDMCDNGTGKVGGQELLITDGINGYIYNVSTGLTGQAVIDYAGANYDGSSVITVTITDPLGYGSGATGTVTYDTTSRVVTSVTVTGGSGYSKTTLPTVTLSGGNDGTHNATVHLLSSNVYPLFVQIPNSTGILDISVMAGGDGYITAPTVVITSTNGSGAQFYATVANGIVTDILPVVTKGIPQYGSGYGPDLPTVTLVGGLDSTGTAAIAQVTSIQGFNKASSCCFINGYFVVSDPDYNSFIVSDIYDGLSWNVLTRSAKSVAADPLLRVFNNFGQLWLFGQYTTEVWSDTGVSATTSGVSPFKLQIGSVMDFGLAATWSLQKSDQGLYFLANQNVGGNHGEFVGIIQASSSAGSMQVISTPAINYQISTFADISDAWGYCTSNGFHTFYRITFDAGDATFMYDNSTQQWTELSTWLDTNQPYVIGRHMADTYVYFNGNRYIGDFRNGNIYLIDVNNYTDNGNPIVRTRTTQHLFDPNDLYNMVIYKLQLDMAVGVGNYSDLTTIDYIANGQYIANGSIPAGPSVVLTVPQAALSWSTDGGYTFNNEHLQSLGGVGQYKTRVIWRRLGLARDRIWKLEISDPVQVIILGCVVNGQRGEV